LPKAGFDPLYDDCVDRKQQAERALDDYLSEVRSILDCSSVIMVPADKKNAYVCVTSAGNSPRAEPCQGAACCEPSMRLSFVSSAPGRDH
jgi:hypothetical protein